MQLSLFVIGQGILVQKMSPVLAVMLAVLPCVVLSQSGKRLEWLPEDMDLYNPLTQHKKCGLEKPGYICDPNRILGDHVDRVNWLLRDAAYNSTKCPCSNYFCETASGPKGYKIGILLVRKLQIQKNKDGSPRSPEEQASVFAYTLEGKSKHGWNMGNCEEDVIVVYSVEDKVIALYYGSTARTKLSTNKRELLFYKISDHLSAGRYVEAMNNLIVDLKIVLNCESDDCDLHQVRSGTAASSASLALLSLAALLTVFIIWS